MKIELRNDGPGHTPYVAVPSALADSLVNFLKNAGIVVDVEANVFRADGHPHVNVRFVHDADHDKIAKLLEKYAAEQRAQKRS